MSTKTDYSVDEWKAIASAPVAAGLLVTLSDASGVVGTAKEAMAVGNAIVQSASGDAPEIVKSLAETVKSGQGRPELPDVPKDRAQARNALIGAIKTAVHAVEVKSPREVDGYKAWLVSVASKVSEASKEGTFFGFGGKLVSAEEEEALKQLNDVLGIGTRH
jgi:hypothetical protein